jgi:ParB-like chromosome segregation protein Spo0J
VALVRVLAVDAARLEVDLHLLELRFSGARLLEPQAVDKLARSIERNGQIVPLIVVSSPDSSAAEGTERLVLIDGYRRVAALRRLGRDRASVERWPCDLTEAVLDVLARTQGRSFAAIEETLLLLREAARRCARDGSWVNRRLQLLASLPKAALAAVREGRLSSWAAARVIALLARANSGHADRLLRAQGQARLSNPRAQAVVCALPKSQAQCSRADAGSPALVSQGTE